MLLCSSLSQAWPILLAKEKGCSSSEHESSSPKSVRDSVRQFIFSSWDSLCWYYDNKIWENSSSNICVWHCVFLDRWSLNANHRACVEWNGMECLLIPCVLSCLEINIMLILSKMFCWYLVTCPLKTSSFIHYFVEFKLNCSAFGFDDNCTILLSFLPCGTSIFSYSHLMYF